MAAVVSSYGLSKAVGFVIVNGFGVISAYKGSSEGLIKL
jgi:hypothetical protein